MKSKRLQESIDVYVWEGKSDIAERIARCSAASRSTSSALTISI